MNKHEASDLFFFKKSDEINSPIGSVPTSDNIPLLLPSLSSLPSTLAPHKVLVLLLDLAADAAMPEDVEMNDSAAAVPAAAPAPADAPAPAPALSTLQRE
jgi:hypothetical protein